MKECKCEYCGNTFLRESNYVNRSKKIGGKLFCSRECFGIFRRVNKSLIQKKLEKRLYDIEYRKKNRDVIKNNKKAYFAKVYAENPEKFRAERKKRMPRHIEYCRTPSYRNYKKNYDQIYRAKNKFGDFWESHVALIELDNLIKSKMTTYEIKLKNGTLNKAMKRGRNGNTKRGYT